MWIRSAFLRPPHGANLLCICTKAEHPVTPSIKKCRPSAGNLRMAWLCGQLKIDSFLREKRNCAKPGCLSWGHQVISLNGRMQSIPFSVVAKWDSFNGSWKVGEWRQMPCGSRLVFELVLASSHCFASLPVDSGLLPWNQFWTVLGCSSSVRKQRWRTKQQLDGKVGRWQQEVCCWFASFVQLSQYSMTCVSCFCAKWNSKFSSVWQTGELAPVLGGGDLPQQNCKNLPFWWTTLRHLFGLCPFAFLKLCKDQVPLRQSEGDLCSWPHLRWIICYQWQECRPSVAVQRQSVVICQLFGW